MTASKKTFVSLCDGDYAGSTASLLKHFGYQRLEDNQHLMADIVVFNGGTDIATSLYEENRAGTHGPFYPSERDQEEIRVYKAIMELPTLKLGICRGAQLLNVLNGGRLWQDVNNHGRDHTMTIAGTNEKMMVTSTHHQMMIPAKVGILIAYANEATRKVADNNRAQSGLDPEIVYYPFTNSLCIQGHPEYVPHSRFAEFSQQLINQYLKELTPSVA